MLQQVNNLVGAVVSLGGKQQPCCLTLLTLLSSAPEQLKHVVHTF